MPITLEKRGDRQAVSLRKDSAVQPIHVNLNWDAVTTKGWFGQRKQADLDLGCMLSMQDGSQGVIQPLGGSFGAREVAPHILLDKDDRSGASSDGENLWIYRPELIQRVLVFAMIYEGAADFTSVNGRLSLKDDRGGEIAIRLGSPDPRRSFCAICLIEHRGDRVEITKEERYFTGHREADAHYGFGFRWTTGSK